MTPYGPLAPYYDQLMSEVDYPGWADYLERMFARSPRPIKTVLDLGCGTGTMAALLVERGYEVVGVDQSAEMLAQAATKAPGALLLHQSMENLDLYDTVDAAICCLDGLNYLPGLAALKGALARVHLFLNPNGLLVFDLLTPYHMRRLHGRVFVSELDDAVCLWKTSFEEDRVYYDFDIFSLTDYDWQRHQEQHIEWVIEDSQIREILATVGFEEITSYADRKLIPPMKRSRRVFYTAVCRK